MLVKNCSLREWISSFSKVRLVLRSCKNGIVLTFVVCNVFFSKANELARSSDLDNVDVFEHCQQTVSEAMVLLILGKVTKLDVRIYSSRVVLTT